MSDESQQYSVTIDDTSSGASLRKFAQSVSSALVRLAKRLSLLERKTVGTKGGRMAGSTIVDLQFVDPVTGEIIFLPGVRFVLPAHNEGNVGFELDLSGTVGGGIGGTVQGYTINYGQNGGEKLTAGLLGNNETPTQPRMDVGFKSKRGGAMEMYAAAAVGSGALERDGQIRQTLGPVVTDATNAGKKAFWGIYRYGGKTLANADYWQCIGGFDANGRLAVGWKNYNFPTDAQLPHPLCVFGEAGDGAAATPGYDATIQAYISKTGVLSGTSIVIGGKTYARTAIVVDGTTHYVLASAT